MPEEDQRLIDAVWRIRRSRLFDPIWYSRRYPEVLQSGLDPLVHYVRFGWGAGYDPNPLFDSDWYQGQNPEAVAAGTNPLLHYIRLGVAQARDPNPLFDSDWYLARHPDVAAAGLNPLLHYLEQGAREGRDPSLFFATAWYRAQNADVAELNPLAHYLHQGLAKGRAPLPDETYPNADAWYDDFRPEVSVVVLNFNKATFTQLCLRHLWRHTDGHRYEILVVDNGSQPDDFARLAAFRGRYRLVRLTQNRLFGEGNNIGAELARARYLCFLNNDALVTAGWLPPLMRVMRQRADCGAVGPKFLYPDGRLQEAGAMIDADGRSVQRGKGENPDEISYNQEGAVDYVSAATVLVDKGVFEKVLGFDPVWEPAYYEDCDLCLKIAQLGLRTYYCPASRVVHFENATTADAEHGLKQIAAVIERNRQVFVGRWRDFLAGVKPPVVAAEPPRPVPAAVNRRRLALYTGAELNDTPGTRLLLAIAAALASEYEAWLVTPERYSTLRLRTLALASGIAGNLIRPIALVETDSAGPFDLAIVGGDDLLPPIPALADSNVFLCQAAVPPPAADLARRWCYFAQYHVIVLTSEQAMDDARAALARLALPPLPMTMIDAEWAQPTNESERFILAWRRVAGSSDAKPG